jgi:hypothetical protein
MNVPTLATIERASFAGHETFPLRYTWLPKAVQHVEQNPRIFNEDDAMVQLGVGKNMVRSIRHWGLATNVLAEKGEGRNRGQMLGATALGAALFGAGRWDPYLEDPATLWVLHYELAGVPERATTWYLAFNHFQNSEFTKDQLVRWLETRIAEQQWGRASPASVRRDVDVFLRTYIPGRVAPNVPIEASFDCPFTELELLQELQDKGTYVIARRDPSSLPDAVFTYGLVRFLQQLKLKSKSVSLQSIAFAPGSPGRVFALTEDALMVRLERVARATKDAVTFSDTAGLRQIFIHNELPEALEILRPLYTGRRAAPSRTVDA